MLKAGIRFHGHLIVSSSTTTPRRRHVHAPSVLALPPVDGTFGAIRGAGSVCMQHLRTSRRHDHLVAAAATSAATSVTQSNGPQDLTLTFTAESKDLLDVLSFQLLVELASTDLDPKGAEKPRLTGFARETSKSGKEITYEAKFTIPSDFGDIGAILLQNQHGSEVFLKDVSFKSTKDGDLLFSIPCNSWLSGKSDDPTKRIFFRNLSFLPNQTPSGLRKLRQQDIESKRGNGQGQRKPFDRIYDYDTYNDLGNPDSSPDLARPVLGGSSAYPYPRRCRTGRPKSKKDPSSETRSGTFYVPRDEEFSDSKSNQFNFQTVKSALEAVVPAGQAAVVDIKSGFPSLYAIDTIYEHGFQLPNPSNAGLLQRAAATILNGLAEVTDDIKQVFRFDKPFLTQRDPLSWLRDEEFARQTLAGVNPYAIQLVTEFPFKSNLDPKIYGPPESAITAEMLQKGIGTTMTVSEAVEKKRLFLLDFHDLFLPYVNKVRQLKGTTLYGSRTVFFLSDDGMLKPLAIELTRPASPTKPQWKQVFLPSMDPTEAWLWRFAKVHVSAHDSGHHQLISHWLRTHCCVEPYIISANRQLSAMHPIYRLLHPHFRYTMKINALARQALINGGGIIESAFFPQKYSMELSSVAYGLLWRFDKEALPNDLIRRGMATEDPTADHGLKLAIEDYPFANDGLLVWSAVKNWVIAYVNYYYPDPSSVSLDGELQAWWTEVRTVGHADKKDEPWWPKLETPAELIQTLTTIIWVTSAHHAAVNFLQYPMSGYFPNSPSIARINVPSEDMDAATMETLQKNPEELLLKTFPSQIQAVTVIGVLKVLSSHAQDEQYLGSASTLPSEDASPDVQAAHLKYSQELEAIMRVIDARNADPALRNRRGAGVVPYEAMKPYSGPGVTGKGVPNSISI